MRNTGAWEPVGVGGMGSSASQPPWNQFPALINPPYTKSPPPFKPRPLSRWASVSPPWLCALGI